MRSARSINSVRTIAGDKREAILRAATTVFAHNGYFNSKVADIAREAGVADGTVYLYFKSKEDILHSIFDRSVDEALVEAKKKIENISDPREKLRQIALLHLERLGADRDLAVVFQVELRGSTKFMEGPLWPLPDSFVVRGLKSPDWFPGSTSNHHHFCGLNQRVD